MILLCGKSASKPAISAQGRAGVCFVFCAPSAFCVLTLYILGSWATVCTQTLSVLGEGGRIQLFHLIHRKGKPRLTQGPTKGKSAGILQSEEGMEQALSLSLWVVWPSLLCSLACGRLRCSQGGGSSLEEHAYSSTVARLHSQPKQGAVSPLRPLSRLTNVLS